MGTLAMIPRSTFTSQQFSEWFRSTSSESFIAASSLLSAEVRAQLLRGARNTGVPLLWMASSGTTSATDGQPRRLVGHSREALRISAESVCSWLGASATDRWARVLPLHHMGGLMIHARSVVSGCHALEWLDSWKAQDFTRWLATEKATIVSLVPAQLHDLVRENCHAPQTLRFSVIGADRLERSLWVRGRELGWNPLPSYGMTETASMIACTRPRSQGSTDSLPLLPHAGARVTELGTLELAGPTLFHSEAHWNSQTGAYELQSRSPGSWQSADRAEIFSADGEVLLRPLGRDSDFVKILGEGVDLAALDLRLSGLLRARGISADSAFVAVPDSRRGTALEIAITRPHLDVLGYWNASCRGIERAVSICVVPEIPRTELGKLARLKLAELARQSAERVSPSIG